MRYGLPSGSLLDCAFKPELLDLAIRGKVSDEEWRKNVASELARRVPPGAAEAAVREWSDFPGQLEAKNLAFMKKLAESCDLVLLTNATTRLHSDLERLGIEDDFDLVINSSEHGAIKPEPAIFGVVKEKLGLAYTDLVFVDDSASHVKAARALGMRAHHFSTLTLLRVEMKDLLGY